MAHSWDSDQVIMFFSCPDVHLICKNDLSSLTVCLNLLICELVLYVLPVVICRHICLLYAK